MDIIFYIIGGLFALGIIVKLFSYVLKLWEICEVICIIIDAIIEFVSYPFVWLKDFLLSLIRKQKSSSEDDSVSPSIFGTKKAKWFLLICALFVGIVLTVSFISGTQVELLSDSFMMFPFFFLFELLAGGNTFSIASLISASFSALLIGWFYKFCMKDYVRHNFATWLISFVYYLITTTAACFAGLFLSNIWSWFSETCLSTYNSVLSIIQSSHWTFLGILKFIGFGIVLLFILYIFVVLLSIAAKEYLESFCYGILAFALFFAAYLIFTLVSSNDITGSTIMIIVYLVGIIGTDFIRVNKEDILFAEDSEDEED